MVLFLFLSFSVDESNTERRTRSVLPDRWNLLENLGAPPHFFGYMSVSFFGRLTTSGGLLAD